MACDSCKTPPICRRKILRGLLHQNANTDSDHGRIEHKPDGFTLRAILIIGTLKRCCTAARRH
ncbi:hypothetical protein XSR1_420019 [Xenorhabdus szentirmaii DSM 16338]|uniref:Uncharacterized protein n=1 Tax=Xenorhabdus szentirmaii DSM 16338 TaxID=1427518 RepID=W1J0K2_9GAMM|nr:hypothetical protein XSR1_420019 [Xenorhabdus szentirmaii DSM 16338]